MRVSLLATALLGTLLPLSALAAPPAGRMANAYRFERGGWTYVHLQGSPADIGFQHGSLLKAEIESNYAVYKLEDTHVSGKPWSYFRAIAKDKTWGNIDAEYRAELQGIADGLKSAGSSLDVWDVVALNNHIEVPNYYMPWLNAKEGKPTPPGLVAPGKCSAFIATGSATKDGKIVMAHSNWSSYAEGERWNLVFDIVPAQGKEILMDGTAGVIASQDDFGVNASGIMITETTLPQIRGWDPKGVPEFVRARKALQYATTIDEYVGIMRERNNGGYANSWLIGDRKTNEIAYLELGLRHTPLTRKADGYFVSSNFAADTGLIRDDTTGFNPADKTSSMNARHKRADAFMQEHKGGIDTALAEAFLSDHFDVFEGKEHADQRSLCGHQDQTAEAVTQWDEHPYEPSGAVTGKVMDSGMAQRMSFTARAGHPCGEDFLAGPFLKAHPEFSWEAPVLKDMKAGPWTTFAAGETKAGAMAKN